MCVLWFMIHLIKVIYKIPLRTYSYKNKYKIMFNVFIDWLKNLPAIDPQGTGIEISWESIYKTIKHNKY